MKFAVKREFFSVVRGACASLCLGFLVLVGTHVTDASSDSLDEFWSLAEFAELNDQQKNNSAAFVERVSANAVKLHNPGKPVKVAVIYPGKQASDYWRRSVLSFEARMKEIGMPYEIGSFFSGSSSYVGNQTQLITAALKNDPDYLVFTLDALRHKPIVQRLIARGRPKVILQNITTPLKAWRERQPFLYVGFDHVNGTKLLIDYYKKTLGPGKKYAILFGPRGYVSRARGNTFLQAYSDTTKMNLKASYYVGYDREKSRAAAERILDENEDIDFIYSCSTDIALGAIDAIKNRNRTTRVMTNGWGGGGKELEALQNGDLEVTVMRMNDDNGVAMAEAIVLDQSGRGKEVPVVFSGEFALVSKENSAEDIDNLKARAFRYSK